MESFVQAGNLKTNYIWRTMRIREEVSFLNYLTKIRCPHLADSQRKYIEQLRQEYHAAGAENLR